jgi:RNA polymerase sigma factor (sigma-70 family)
MNNKRNTIIIEGIIKGDEVILTNFYKQNIHYVRSYITRNSGCEEDVEDVFQDALMLIYQKLQANSLEIKNSSVRTYFVGVCKNIWKNRLRRKRKIILDESVIEINNECINDSIIDDMADKEKQCLYRKYFLKLNESNKKVLYLFFEGKSMKEIANVMGYTEAYTRKKKFQSKKSLLEMIEQDPIYHELKI